MNPSTDIPGLRLKDVCIRLNDRSLLRIDQTVAPGEVLTIMGSSGSGKSTLLAYIGGFLDPAFSARGEIVLNGRRLDQLPIEHRRIGILFQDPLLFPHMSVRQNLMFAIPRGRSGRQDTAERALDKAGLSGLGDRDPATLSGGQKARAALMRALMSEPEALLLDEPFSKLDTERRARTRDMVFDQAKAQGLPVVLVTHDPADAAAADGPIVLIDRPAA